MTTGNEEEHNFHELLRNAAVSIRKKELTVAKVYIKQAILENADAPEPHNLLGILEELEGDVSMAGKHYRAAYALDPTYKPAHRNLERITSFPPRTSSDPGFDYGDQPEIVEEELRYAVEYNEKNVGHLVRRKTNEEKTI